MVGGLLDGFLFYFLFILKGGSIMIKLLIKALELWYHVENLKLMTMENIKVIERGRENG